MRELALLYVPCVIAVVWPPWMTIDVGLRSPSDVNEGMCTDGGRDAAGNGCVDIWCSGPGGVSGWRNHRRGARRPSRGGAGEIGRLGARHVAFVGVNSPAVPVTVLAAGLAGVPVTPLNYRLAGDALRELIGRLDSPLIIADPEFLDVVEHPAHAVGVLRTAEWMRLTETVEPGELPFVDDEQAAVMLFTSGTTSHRKVCFLRHSHLVSYVLQTVEFGSAGEEEAALISVPPYHVRVSVRC